MDNWQAWEHSAAAVLGLDTTITSGNRFYDPGDATSRDRRDPFPLLVDCKLTEKASFSLKAKELRQYTVRAAEAGKRFVLPVRFWTPQRVDDYVVMGFHDFVEMRGCR